MQKFIAFAENLCLLGSPFLNGQYICGSVIAPSALILTIFYRKSIAAAGAG